MPYQLTILPQPGYLHLKVTGVNSPETVQAYLKDVVSACAEHRCPNVLIEENLSGPGLKISEIFQVASEGSKHVWPVIQRIAYTDVNPEHDLASMQFAETVAVNRHVNVRVFATIEQAKAWMESAIAQA